MVFLFKILFFMMLLNKLRKMYTGDVGFDIAFEETMMNFFMFVCKYVCVYVMILF